MTHYHKTKDIEKRGKKSFSILNLFGKWKEGKTKWRRVFVLFSIRRKFNGRRGEERKMSDENDDFKMLTYNPFLFHIYRKKRRRTKNISQTCLACEERLEKWQNLWKIKYLHKLHKRTKDLCSCFSFFFNDSSPTTQSTIIFYVFFRSFFRINSRNHFIVERAKKDKKYIKKDSTWSKSTRKIIT